MKRFGLIGKSLKHSFSQNYFSQKFLREGMNGCSYENFELPSIDAFTALLRSESELCGLNITIPYKEEILPFLHTKNKIVEQVGACNCIKIIGSELHGYNTDVVAFRESLKKRLKAEHKCALVLGSGGASKAIQFALTELNIDYLVVSRNKKTNQVGYEDVGEKLIRDHQIIINTTPLGMYPNIDQDPPIPYEAISSRHLLYDLTYNPEKTKFLRQGEAHGAEILNGYEMLVAQAEESWRIWNG
ncbi:MAG: shikimate dehydrogenase family protein [Flavisolibacter sp.]